MKFLCCGKGDRVDGDQVPPRLSPAPSEGEVNSISSPITHSTGVPPMRKKTAVPRDLWTEAYNSLPEERRNLVPLKGTGSTTDAIDMVIEQTKAKYTEWQESGFKIQRKDEKDIDVRATSEKILDAALQAKALISNLTAFDPTGKGKIPVYYWGMSHSYAFSFGGMVGRVAWSDGKCWVSRLLVPGSRLIDKQMISNNNTRRDATFASSEYLAESLAYYALIDAHYRDDKMEGGENFDRALLRVYTAILEYTAEVTKRHQESFIGTRPIVHSAGIVVFEGSLR
ncbi:hypothetical protein N7516_009998 [Penicillium verrucosum]|uniref:uncharacterized protein n=1 Tax=Penicillium verrucosum TaxID=60171 RepID=UPI0025459DC7|nr:uncharacterized protein N7516_009998 [Penicillium verrucosum]KAJ5922295.1 hypothetical protein N7516_009998 [Penicillium verrucosum]